MGLFYINLMPEPFRIHRYLVGRTRAIGLEIPERSKKHADDSDFVRHWQSTFSNALAAAHSRVRAERRFVPSVVRQLEQMISNKTESDFRSGIERVSPTRSGNVLLVYRMPPGFKEIPLSSLRTILAENPNLFGSAVVVRRHRRGTRP